MIFVCKTSECCPGGKPNHIFLGSEPKIGTSCAGRVRYRDHRTLGGRAGTCWKTRGKTRRHDSLGLQSPSKKVLWVVFRGLSTCLEGIWSPRDQDFPFLQRKKSHKGYSQKHTKQKLSNRKTKRTTPSSSPAIGKVEKAKRALSSTHQAVGNDF